jgi:xylulokinase
MQIIADVTNRPVLTIEEDVEAAMGAALLAAYGAALVSADDVRRGWVTLAPRATPRPRATAAYARLFASYKALYPALTSTMHDLHAQRAVRESESSPVTNDRGFSGATSGAT